MDTAASDMASVQQQPKHEGGKGQLPLSDDEQRILELYHQLRQLEQELALTRALHEYEPSPSARNPATADDIEAAQQALADSRARYVLRNQIVDSVLSVNPVLQAVHHGVNASPIERDLAPVLTARDKTSTAFAKQSTTLREILDSATAVEIQFATVSRENVTLAAQVLELAAEAAKNKSQPVTDPAQAAEIAELEVRMKASRQRFRVAKGTASAIVAGSGVDWARDPELRSIVLDAEEDD
ncbi:centromere protein H (CENP-H)-domain-containing protein [Microdochium trichocladiopsis]|uniref:Centromere protein H (CENP-H)-domain-containing protein n=1 Tax=Microdochium trichocladiopsis TaxID=1682393 RepID=A0A9P9BMV8_9PEZI|nr:centromere protein H (CENP-H)-domain-containing protein [Microdochium trichocladiopsis]KAH7026668.1 centromere protein H (CENP-H)-domain-containing protein [Microdochium trichocladiopsis]